MPISRKIAADFDTIWAFTRTEMLLRDDGLAVWRWDPAATPHVSDSNNATDGDLLIAYAAALAGRDWQRPDLVEVATRMAVALAESSVEEIAGSVMLKPGNVGFGPGDRPDGPVVNPSYWVFEALPVLAALAPDGPWTQLADGGHALVVAAMNIGPSKLPPDWVSLKAKPTPADGFPQEFGYNAIRIPLYLMRAGTRDRALLEAFQQNMADAGGRVRLVDIKTGATRQTLDDAGYKAIPALIGCVLDKKPLPDDVKQFEPTEYYPSTLHLLALSFARRRHPNACEAGNSSWRGGRDGRGLVHATSRLEPFCRAGEPVRPDVVRGRAVAGSPCKARRRDANRPVRYPDCSTGQTGVTAGSRESIWSSGG